MLGVMNNERIIHLLAQFLNCHSQLEFCSLGRGEGRAANGWGWDGARVVLSVKGGLCSEVGVEGNESSTGPHIETAYLYIPFKSGLLPPLPTRAP